MNKNTKEALLLLLAALPYLYLGFIWGQLAERVPIHFDANGEADGWSGKELLLVVPTGLGLLMYFLLHAIPFLDPKGRLQEMGGKYDRLRFVLILFFSALAVYLLRASYTGSIGLNGLLGFLGVFFAALGNYFQAIRPNYFIGIRTPWTLESTQVWRKTHYMAGYLWIGGGLLIALLALLIADEGTLLALFGVLLTIMAVGPLVYSYRTFRKERSNSA